MFTWDDGCERDGHAVALDSSFTAEEAGRLRALREHYGGHPALAELGLDYRRLAYGAWLVRRGIVGEEFGEIDNARIPRDA
jgi:hypothetical protein